MPERCQDIVSSVVALLAAGLQSCEKTFICLEPPKQPKLKTTLLQLLKTFPNGWRASLFLVSSPLQKQQPEFSIRYPSVRRLCKAKLWHLSKKLLNFSFTFHLPY